MPTTLGRFHVINSLKRENEAETFLGEDLSTGKRFVLKTIPARWLGFHGREHLDQKLKAIRQMGNEEFSFELSTFEEDKVLCLSRPFIEAPTLKEKLATAKLSVQETLALGRNLMTALESAHRRDILHLNIKPSNLLLNGNGATLVDFSLLPHGPLDALLREQSVESILYTAPECLGLLEREADKRADFYSVGCLLYHCLVGRPPFEGSSIGDLLHTQMTAQPSGLGDPALAVPRALQKMILRLLSKDPRDRYQSSEGILADLAAISASLTKGDDDPYINIGAHDRRQILTEPVFIGRLREQQAMDAELERVIRGQGNLVYLEGESGSGKSWLMGEIARQAVQKGAWVIRSQTVDRNVQKPFELLAGVATEIFAKATSTPDFAGILRERLGAYREVVTDILPELAAILGKRPAVGSMGPEAFGEWRSLQALTVLFDALGLPHAPVVLLLDDCQWADSLTVKLIEQWQRRPLPDISGGRHTMIMAAFRTEEVPQEHPLRRWKPSTHLVLRQFPQSDVRDQAESMAGPLPDEVIATLQRLSEGNPFMVSAVLHGMVESGAIVPTPYGWAVEADALKETQSSRQSAAVLIHRIKLLPPDALRLLSAGAILGKEFELALAAELAGLSSETAVELAEESCRRSILWAREGEGRFAFVHDKLREAFSQMLSEQERRLLHQKAGERISESGSSRVFELSYHFDEAGLPEKALPYALAAAAKSRTRYALDAAEHQYRIADRGAEDQTTRFQIRLGLGDTLMLRGGYKEAYEWYEKARALAPDALQRAKLESRIGELAFKQSDYPMGIDACSRGLSILGRPLPKGKVFFPFLFLWEALLQALHGFFPKLFLGRSPLGTEGAESDLLAVALYDRLIYLWFFSQFSKPATAWVTLRSVNLAETYPATVELGHAYSVFSNILGTVFPPLVFWSYELRERALSIQKSLGNVHGQGQALAYRWPMSYIRMEFADGMARAREGKKLLALAGDQWDVNSASWGIAMGHYFRGEFDDAVKEAKALYEAAKAISDVHYIGNALWIWALASEGRLPKEPVKEALGLPNLFVATKISLLGAEGIRLLSENRIEEAQTMLGEAADLIVDNSMVDGLIGGVLPWHLTAMRVAAERASPLDPEKRRILLGRAGRVARRARFYGRIFRLFRPHALRESGYLWAMQGRMDKARKCLEASLEQGGKSGMRYESAMALRATGRIGMQGDWPGAKEALAQAGMKRKELSIGEMPPWEAQVEETSIPTTLSLVDRFRTVLDRGRSIATSLSRESVFIAVREAGLILLRAEKCQVLEKGSELDAIPTLPTGDPTYDRSLIEAAVATGKPSLFNVETSEDKEGKIAHSGVKSALCAPIIARGKLAACFYATHSQVAGLFGEEEARLADFIATLAGAALENSMGLSELEALHKTMQSELERLVEKRTLELQGVNKELQAFSYSVSHNLRAPLRALDGFSQILLKDHLHELDPKGQEYLRRVRAGAQRMAQLIDDLLGLSRVTSSELLLANIDLAEIAGEVVAELRESQPGRNVEFLIQKSLPAYGDVRLMRVALMNLLGNAFKFTGKVEQPKIEFGEIFQEGRRTFYVRDNGAGFDMRYADKLFGAFQRLHSQEQFAGTGIGLATVQRVLHRHSGIIWAESEPGHGATFYFTLGPGPDTQGKAS